MEKDINLTPTFKQNTEYLCVEYPGIVANKKKMLATLGGIKHLEDVYNDSTKRLDLRFRPDDPGCKPLCGDKTPSTSLLLKLRKYRRKKKDNASMDSPEEFKYQQTICGIVSFTYKFSTLCDYQYLTLRKNDLSGKIENMIPHININSSTIENNGFFTKDIPLFLPPPTYGRLDTPHHYHYKKECVKFRRKPVRSRNTALYNKISLRKSRRNNCIGVGYEDKVPTECLPQALEVYEGIRGHIAAAKDAIVECFKERPIWSKNALQVNLDYGAHFLRVLLPVVAYYSTSGPWARLWVRLGYDPKLDPTARKYQIVDFRLRQGVHSPYIPIKAKRSTLTYKLPQTASKPHQTEKSVSSFAPTDSKSTESTSRRRNTKLTKASFLFEPGVLPCYRQIFYQACDINLPEAQAFLEKSDPNQTTCSKENGWFLPNTQAEVRALITADIYKTLSQRRDPPIGSEFSDISKENPKELLKSTFDQEVEEATGDNTDDSDDGGETDDSGESSTSKTPSQDDFMEEDSVDIEDEGTDDGDSEGEDGALYFQDDDELDAEEQVRGAAALFEQQFPPM